MKQKTIPVIVIRYTNSGEADEVYRLDRAADAAAFFANTKNNVERGQVHHFCVKEYTKEQWRLAELAGRSFGGDMSPKQEKEYDALIKKKANHHEEVKWPS